MTRSSKRPRLPAGDRSRQPSRLSPRSIVPRSRTSCASSSTSTCAARPDRPARRGFLRREGLAMLSCVLADLALCPGVEALALAEPDLANILPCREIHTPSHESAEASFRRLARSADFTLVSRRSSTTCFCTAASGPLPRAAGCSARRPPPCASPRTSSLSPTTSSGTAYRLHPPGTSSRATGRTGPIRLSANIASGPARSGPPGFMTQAKSVAYLQSVTEPMARPISSSSSRSARPARQRRLSWRHGRASRLARRGAMSFPGRPVRLPGRTAAARTPVSGPPPSAWPNRPSAPCPDCPAISAWISSLAISPTVAKIQSSRSIRALTTSYVGLRRLARGNLMQSASRPCLRPLSRPSRMARRRDPLFRRRADLVNSLEDSMRTFLPGLPLAVLLLAAAAAGRPPRARTIG